MILDEIVANKRVELEAAKRQVPLAEMERRARQQSPAKDFAAALKGDRLRLIAEVKKASPSKGLICVDFDPVKTAKIYADNGASAISVLTDSKYFQGSLNDLQNVSRALGQNGPPLLRKDFIVDAYQVFEARAYGADALLLIVAVLMSHQLRDLISLTHRLGMNCLVEVHNEAEAEAALRSQAKVIGINNRDLKTFLVDITTTQRLRKMIPADRIVVSESGIKDRSDMDRIRDWGADAVLIGEALMSAPNTAARMKELL